MSMSVYGASTRLRAVFPDLSRTTADFAVGNLKFAILSESPKEVMVVPNHDEGVRLDAVIIPETVKRGKKDKEASLSCLR